MKSLLPIRQPSSEKTFMTNYPPRSTTPLPPSSIPMSIESLMHVQETTLPVPVMNQLTVETPLHRAAARNQLRPLRALLMGEETRMPLGPFPSDPPLPPMLT
jgi:hypothetical protein